MKRVAALAALAPAAATAHQTGTPHVHASDPTLLMGLGAIAILMVIAIIVKRRT
ncbi:hypothetical protein LA6_004679 [Marinibacterium anthonyi]|nr:hypothetical protein LA6_004679 [Marinibacterium anthonyi]|tara:strand:- start:1073 stop:1234 length:162 start_codon:yes stop_codon:yes gene_type:complete